MSSYELGRVGIVLLALYLVLEVFSGVIPILGTVAQSAQAGDVFSLQAALTTGVMIAGVMIVGAIPAAVLIANRDRLARRWFSDGGGEPIAAQPAEFAQVGLVLLGISAALAGAAGVISVLVAWAAVPSSAEGAIPGEGAIIGRLSVQSAVELAAGAALVRYARPLSERWAK
jgi:hypothetical protein